MSSRTKEKLWDVIRPLHRPLTRALRRRLGRNYQDHPEMELPPPYDAIQFDVERHLHNYLQVSADQIAHIVIVGAHRADEIERMQKSYPRAAFTCFEPNPHTHAYLVRKFAGSPGVSVAKLALSSAPGKATFYELSMEGNGSLLKPDVDSWAKATASADKSVTSFEVELSTLDVETAKLPAIDLLWMDVQGAEGQVLSGATEALKRIKAVFVEIALVHSPYGGAELFPQIKARLETAGFMCTGLGVDAHKGDGNAFFVKGYERLVGK